MSVLFGQQVTRSSMVRKLSKLISRKEVESRMISTLKLQKFVEAAWDNTQNKESLKFQREGISALMKIYTSMVFTNPTIPDDIDEWDFGALKALITYVDQNIPSPFGMPPYHEFKVITPKTFLEDHSLGRFDGVDVSGNTVEQLASNIILARKIYDLHRLFEIDSETPFKYQNLDAHKAMALLRIFEQMAGCRQSGRYGSRPTFFTQCYQYQLRETTMWRPNVPALEAIVPPLLPFDETTNVGAAKVIISMLRMAGILECDHEDGNDISKLKLAPDWNERTFMLTGDGLSQVRARSLVDLISSTGVGHFS